MLAPVTGLALWLLRLLWRPIRPSLPERVRLFCLALGSLLYFPGVGLMLWGRITLGKMHNVSSAAGAQLYANHRLITAGPFGLIRHPMYVGGIMAEAGGLLLYRTWATALITLNALSLPLRARREEELLAARFGTEWEEYTRDVPAWIPRIGRR
jgi:protein-S-isoprenylcysteine O-methyltransferase Ste14